MSNIVVGDLTYEELLKEWEETNWLNWRDDCKSLCDALGVKYSSTSFGENLHTIRNHFRRLGYYVSVELTDSELTFTENKDLAPKSKELVLMVFNALLISIQFEIYSNIKREYNISGLVKYRDKEKFREFTHEKLVEHSLDVAIDRFNKYFKE